MDQPPSTFKADDEKKNEVRATNAPQCMSQIATLQSDRPSLTNEQFTAAKSDLLHKDFINLSYPKTQKFRVDPRISGQSYGLISFLPSLGAKPDQDGCFGVLKLRGNFPTVEDADNWSENLIRNYDSFSEIDMVYIGKDFPLMVDSSIYTAATREIDVKKTVDSVTKANLKAKREQEEREIKEIQERQTKLLNPKHEEEKDKSIDDLDYYVQLRVKKANAQMLIDEANKKIAEAQEVINKTDSELIELEQNHPDYKDEFMGRYQNALKSVGADASKNPLIQYMNK